MVRTGPLLYDVICGTSVVPHVKAEIFLRAKTIVETQYTASIDDPQKNVYKVYGLFNI